MNSLSLPLRLVAAVALAASAHAQAVEVRHGILASETWYETPYTTIESDRPGPTILLTGGIHGNEPAGARAARQIAGWTITRGKLIVIPRTNELALRANKRRTPGLAKAESDLNRQFPTSETPAPTGVLANAIWDLVEREQPDFLIDLHEGFDYTRRNAKSVGSSVIATSPLRAHARRMITAVDATISVADKRFTLKRSPIVGSLARSAFDVLGIPSVIVETTTKGQAVAYRVRQHRILVHALLSELSVIDHGPHVLVGSAADSNDIKVALYVSTGVGGSGPVRLEQLLTGDRDFVLRRVCATDIRAGALAQFDTVIFPGGSGAGQAKALGVTGRDAVRGFVREGGGYLGICAGAYLAANNYEWSLRILDANVIDRAHWARGKASVAIEWTSGGDPQAIKYANGPLYEAAGDPGIPDFEVLATFRGEVNDNDAPVGVMLGTPAIVTGKFGEGTVVCSSPHPEQTAGLEDVVRQMVRRSSGAQ